MNEKYRDELRKKASKISENQRFINEIENGSDYMDLISNFSTFNQDGANISISYFKCLPDSVDSWAFQLTIRNMRDIYQQSWKWDEETKKEELFNDSARYLVAFQGDLTPVGFIHFRFEQLDGCIVTYIYDVQVENSVKNTNLRKFLIQATEMLSLKLKVEAVVTFVFKADKDYFELLQKMQYQYHPTSPSVYNPNEPEKYKHEILFKSLVRSQ